MCSGSAWESGMRECIMQHLCVSMCLYTEWVAGVTVVYMNDVGASKDADICAFCMVI